MGLTIALFGGMLASIGIAVVFLKLLFYGIALVGIFDIWCYLVVDKTCAWQTCEEYPNAGNWIEITLHKGDTVFRNIVNL